MGSLGAGGIQAVDLGPGLGTIGWGENASQAGGAGGVGWDQGQEPRQDAGGGLGWGGVEVGLGGEGGS